MPNQEQLKPMSWRKTAGVFHLRRLDGTEEITTAGQTFLALPEEIPQAFRDTIKPVDPAELEARGNPPLEMVEGGYQVVPRGKVPGRYNVVDGRGKLVNGQALTADGAASLLETLGG